MKKKVTIINKNGISIEVSEEIANVLSSFDNDITHESLINSNDKNNLSNVENEQLSISEQIFYIEMLSDIKSDKRDMELKIKNVLFDFYKDETGNGYNLSKIEELIKFLKIEIQENFKKNNLKKILSVAKDILKTYKTSKDETINHNTNLINKYPSIFTTKGYKIWCGALIEFDLLNRDKVPRTDLRFIYEIMKTDSYIHEPVTITNFTNWLNEENIINKTIDKLQWTGINNSSNKKRMGLYNAVIKNIPQKD
ncbi:hypothetical protein [Empedobacter brevis]|uniref:hypothetical protein n=1 Tax=Empedobacter brevis TaxID=247 RepID=UPI0028A615ED|nr:hypothetical protein [Empedobacter brevis]